jgi:hypothetical protein
MSRADIDQEVAFMSGRIAALHECPAVVPPIRTDLAPSWIAGYIDGAEWLERSE